MILCIYLYMHEEIYRKKAFIENVEMIHERHIRTVKGNGGGTKKVHRVEDLLHNGLF